MIISPEKLQIVVDPKILGKGQYGQVHEGFVKDNPDLLYAIKVMDRNKITPVINRLLMNEI